jgi:hypothetical protein
MTMTSLPAKTRPALTAQRLGAFSIGTLVVGMSLRPTVDPDLWWHLPTGELILSGGWPDSDVFSHSVPGREWVTHEWLSQVVMELVHRAGGFVGLMVFFGIIGLATCGIVYRTSRMVGAGPLMAAAFTYLVARTSLVAWGARPQLFNVLLAATTVWLIESVRRGRLPASRLTLLVPLAVVWANLHSGFYAGVAIVGTYAIGDLIDARFASTGSRFDVATAKRLLGIAGTMLVVAVINPSGPRLWLYPFETLGSDAQQELIREWLAPDLGESMWRPFALMLVAGLVGFAYSNLRVTATDLFLFVGTAAAGLTSLRHVSLFAVIAAPAVLRHVMSALERTPAASTATGERDLTFRSRGLVVVVLAGLCAATAISVVRNVAANDDAIADNLPVTAVDVAVAAGLDSGNVFNTYSYGGYLVWRDIDVFIDGRADVYGADMLRAHHEVSVGGPSWATILDDFDISWTVVKPDTAIVSLLDLSGDWERAYTDDIAVIHRRMD